MEQHAIPQQISSYEFKLVGDMTLKQFLKAAVGIILAILINSSKIVAIVKWPLMILCGGGGLVLAFVPFEDRPLEAWIFSFIKSIYSPTIFTYKRIASKNWLDLDLTKKTEQGEDDLVRPNKASFWKNRIKDSIDTMGIKNSVEEKIEVKKIEQTEPIEITTETKLIVNTPLIETNEKLKQNDWRDKETNLNLKTEKLNATGKVVFGEIPMPSIPEVPNLIVGMATNDQGKIIEGVIVEIQDEHGNPSRVLKTNSLGQFKTTTPLASGRYLVIAEKDGYNFDRVNIDLSGQIVQPVKIISNS